RRRAFAKRRVRQADGRDRGEHGRARPDGQTGRALGPDREGRGVGSTGPGGEAVVTLVRRIACLERRNWQRSPKEVTVAEIAGWVRRLMRGVYSRGASAAGWGSPEWEACMARDRYVWALDVYADRDRWPTLDPPDLPEELQPLRDPAEFVRRFREYGAA